MLITYLISRIHYDFHIHHEQMCELLKQNIHNIEIFIPHLYNPCNILPKYIQETVYVQDLSEMIKSKFGIISFPIGKDCSAEVGWFHGNSKKTIGLIWNSSNINKSGISCMEQYKSIQDDWMVKGFITNIVVINCIDTYNEILKDSILKHKVFYLDSFSSIDNFLKTHGYY